MFLLLLSMFSFPQKKVFEDTIVKTSIEESSFHQAYFELFKFGHGLMLLWFKDLMNVTEKLQFIDPTFRHSCLVPSLGVIETLQQEVLLYDH